MSQEQNHKTDTTVRQHFERAFPGYTFDRDDYADALASMPLDSNCGDDCRRIIDAAKAWTALVDAPGEGEAAIAAAISATAHTCVVFICG